MSNAHDFWGSSCHATAANCNGDNSGILDWNTGGSSNDTNDNEAFCTWQHLTLSGLLPGVYSGVSTGGDTDGLTAADVPFSKDNRGKFYMTTLSYSQIFESGGAVKAKRNLGVILGGPSTSDSIWVNGTTVLDAYTIDKKMDDGLGNLGKMIALSTLTGSNTSCTQGGNQVGGADYNSSNFGSATLNCALIFFFLK